MYDVTRVVSYVKLSQKTLFIKSDTCILIDIKNETFIYGWNTLNSRFL